MDNKIGCRREVARCFTYYAEIRTLRTKQATKSRPNCGVTTACIVFFYIFFILHSGKSLNRQCFVVLLMRKAVTDLDLISFLPPDYLPRQGKTITA